MKIVCMKVVGNCNGTDASRSERQEFRTFYIILSLVRKFIYSRSNRRYSTFLKISHQHQKMLIRNHKLFQLLQIYTGGPIQIIIYDSTRSMLSIKIGHCVRFASLLLQSSINVVIFVQIILSCFPTLFQPCIIQAFIF